MGSIRKKGEKYYFRIMVTEKDGTRKQREFAGSPSLSETKKIMIKKKAEFQDSLFLKSSKMFIFDLLDIWLDETSIGLKKSSINSRKVKIKSIKTYFKNDQIGKINLYNLQLQFNELVKKGFSNNYLASIKSVLLSSFNYSIKVMGILKENPCLGIELKGKKQSKRHIYTKEEYAELKSFFRSKHNKYYYYFLVLGLKTGMRRGELLGLEWKHINFRENKITVEQAGYYIKKEFIIDSPKTSESIREIYFDEEVQEILKEIREIQLKNKVFYDIHYKDTNIIFQQENGIRVTQGFTTMFSKYVRELLKIESPIHSMRHTHITWLVEGGANLKAIQNRVGHKDIQTTLNIYTQITDNMKKDITELTKKF